MVCVMLRLIEYFQGVLFLTSNRIGALDPAFQSRVQCALRYDALDETARAQVRGRGEPGFEGYDLLLIYLYL